MKLKELAVARFRNIEAIDLRFDGGLCVIAGENGQGKTNLLESIYLLTGGKSFRGGKDADLLPNGEGKAGITGLCEAGGAEKRIQLTVEGGQSGRRGRFASVNGVDYGRAGEIAGIFTAVVFEPNHLMLVKAGPDGRRRFLDAALCQLYPGYLAILRRFSKALAQKNALLRRYYETRDAEMLLDAFDDELAKSGEEMTRRRAHYMAEAAPLAEAYYHELTHGAETLRVAFLPAAAEGELAALLQKRRQTDIKAGFCTAGPQREDFEVQIGGTSARTFGSQGQQRSAVLALKLAEAATALKVTGEHPVLLLDDVLSELDEGRQRYLLGEMGGGQSFVTTCDASAFERAAGQTVFIKAGAVQRQA